GGVLRPSRHRCSANFRIDRCNDVPGRIQAPFMLVGLSMTWLGITVMLLILFNTLYSESRCPRTYFYLDASGVLVVIPTAKEHPDLIESFFRMLLFGESSKTPGYMNAQQPRVCVLSHGMSVTVKCT
ncbi:MAG: hypothetical protein K8I82_11875, partial [Anaerolineae bacterium]|nr:hypothetical protein [Anaerolineae bacterium]